jgi:dipeptidyl aminopeptidase/acylaminoacyl peptidase
MFAQWGRDILSETGPNWVESQMGLAGDPWSVQSRYIANSPFMFLDRVKTPLFLYQGDQDPITGDTDAFFRGLRKLGKVAEYARYEGEDHSPLFWSRENAIDLSRRIFEWFAKYMSPR